MLKALVAAVAATAAIAIASGVGTRPGGDGISGYRVSDVSFVTRGDSILDVQFRLDKPARSVEIALVGGRLQRCAPSAGPLHLVRCVFSPAVAAVGASSLSVLASA